MNTNKKNPAKAGAPPPKPKPQNKPDIVSRGFFDQYGNKFIYFAAAIIAIIGLIIYWDFLSLNKIFLYKDVGDDSLNGYYPFVVQICRGMQNLGHISWTFNLGMGQNIYPFAYADPFDALIYLFSPSKIMWLMGYKEYLKIILTGITFYLFLKTSGRSNYASLIGAMMYSFCGYIIVTGSGWQLLSTLGFDLALILLSFELLFKKNNPWLFPLPIFLVSISIPFDLFMFTVFLGIYGTFRYIQEDRKGIKGLAIIFSKLLLMGIIGVAISAPVLIGLLKTMLESSRASGPNNFFAQLSSAPVFSVDGEQLGTGINRWFCSGIFGTGSNYKGWGNILEGPAFYCGIPCLLLTPLVFGYLTKREKTVFGVILGFWLLPFIFPFFRYALWLFTGDYYRTYSLLVAIIFIIFSVYALDKLTESKKLNIKILIATVIVLLILQAIPYFGSPSPLNKTLVNVVRILIIAYAAIIFWMAGQSDKKNPMIVFGLLLVIELASFSFITVNRNKNITSAEMNLRVGYNDYTKEALEYIKKTDLSPFYRIDKSYGATPAEHTSLNDGLVFDYKGTCSYNSFGQKYYLQFLRTYGIVNPAVETDSRWPLGTMNNPVLGSLNSVKYIMTKSGYVISLWKNCYDSVGKFQDILLLKSKFSLPLGYTYDKYIKYSELMKISNSKKEYMSLRVAIVNDDEINQVKGLQESKANDSLILGKFNLQTYKEWTDSLAKDTLNIKTFSDDHLIGNINLKTDKILYLSIPYDIGWHVELDGKTYKPLLLSNGMIGIVPGIGQHKIELQYIQPYYAEGKLAAFSGWFVWLGLISFGFWHRRKKLNTSPTIDDL